MARKNKQSRRKKGFLIVMLILVLLSAGLAFLFLAPNINQERKYLYVATGSSLDDVLATLQEERIVRNMTIFKQVATLLNYQKVLPGKYPLKAINNNFQLVRLLKSGKQEPVNLVLKKFRTKEQLVQFISSKLEPDSLALLQWLESDSFLNKYQLTAPNAIAVLMPNTYQFYWNTTPQKVFTKIAEAYTTFWNEERKQKAEKLKFSPLEIITLASIVEEESNLKSEQPTIASVYINRLRLGMKLQADPTVKFAVGDFGLRRIYNKHLMTASPYNTYLNYGLPPGPICTPSATTIDAVLNAASTDYLFFCAKDDLSGAHAFAKTYQEHLVNAKKYTQALNARGIQ